GKGTKVSGSKDGIAYDINVDQNSPLSINNDGALTVDVGGFDNTTDGSVKANNPNGLATAGDIANAVNNSGWNLTTSASTGEVSGTSKELIKPTNTVTFDAGDNIRIVQSGNQISVGTTRNINVAGNLNVAGNTNVHNLNVAPNSNVDMGGNQIHNVAPGTADTDAVNVSQLKQAMGNNKNWEPRINQVENRANAGVAQAMATAGLPQAYLPGKSMFAAGTGVYRGEVGYAVGVSSISDGGNWIVKGTASGNSRGNFGATAAIGYQW
ncbi:MAG: YadA-like family protein, partial [Neisseriaceae bacterium]|nr:YadA-like family protein [Neisseriaceae bacterium]